MKFKQTGFAEIDEQHSILDELLLELDGLCSYQIDFEKKSCIDCNSEVKEACYTKLVKICSDLKAFLLGHNNYEEKLMDLLPDSVKCRQHIIAHKSAHQSIMREIEKFSSELTKDNIQSDSLKIFQIINAWKGGHIEHFDTGLAKYLKENKFSEIHYDDELVAILDEFVFNNRPSKRKPSVQELRTIQKKTLEARGRYASLTHAQRNVFWLVIKGKTSNEIAIELGVSINTVKTHRKTIFRKMEVETMFELIKIADLL